MPNTQPKVELIDLNKLKPADNNARTHSTEQVEQIVASIQHFGFTNPILIDEDFKIIAGHGRREAAEALQLKTVPCIKTKGWTDEQKRAYLIADNKLALNAGWDMDILRTEIGELQQLDFEIPLLGFSPAELDGIFGIEPDQGDDEPDQGSDDTQQMVECPECGRHFDAKEHKAAKLDIDDSD